MFDCIYYNEDTKCCDAYSITFGANIISPIPTCTNYFSKFIDLFAEAKENIDLEEDKCQLISVQD